MYKSIIETNPFDKLQCIPRILDEINDRGEKIISFFIQPGHHDATKNVNVYRSFVWIVEVPEPTERI